MVGTATVTARSGGRAALRRRLHRVPRQRRAPGRRPPTPAGANPFASEVTVEAEGQHTVEFRSVDKAGNVETAKSVAFGIDIPEPGTPVIEAFADPATGAAPLLTRFSASGYDPDGGELSYKWEFADGTVLGRAVTRTLHQAGHVHGEGDRDRRRGREVLQGGHGHRDGAGRPAADRRGRGRPHQRPRAAGGQVHRHGRRPGRRPALLRTRGSSATAARRSTRTRRTSTTRRARTRPSVTVSDGSGATATKTITITVTNAPGNVAPIVTSGPCAVSPHGNPMEVDVHAPGQGPERRRRHVRVGLRRQLGQEVRRRRSTTSTPTPGTYNVKVTATDARARTTTKTISVTVSPTANIAADGRCPGRPGPGHRSAGGPLQLAGRGMRTATDQPRATCGRSATAASPPRRTRSTPTRRPASTPRR